MFDINRPAEPHEIPDQVRDALRPAQGDRDDGFSLPGDIPVLRDDALTLRQAQGLASPRMSGHF